MKQNYYLFTRKGTFYCQDGRSGEQKSLGTRDEGEAKRLMEIKRQSSENPSFKRLMLKACLSDMDEVFAKRTWSDVMNQMCPDGKESTQLRYKRASKHKALNSIRHKRLIETTPGDLLEVMKDAGPPVNHYLKRFHNLAVGLGWVSCAILPPKLWPKPKFKQKRSITAEEHKLILDSEQHPERKSYYQLLWEIGAAQTDAASLTAAQIDWSAKILSFQRRKTQSWCGLAIGPALEAILKALPTEGALFPSISKLSANDRAAEFYRRCKILKIEGISLHSYRYAWAERANCKGFPERFAQQALGHNSKAVHRYYSKNALVTVPSMEDYGRERKA